MVRERVIVFMASASSQSATYFLNEYPDVTEEANFSPLALVRLQKRLGLKEYPHRAIVLLTEMAEKEQGNDIAAAFNSLGIEIEPTPIPDGNNPNELRIGIERLLSAIPDNCDVTLDITHGFRSAPFIYAVAAQYLSFVRPSVKVEHLYYGMFKSKFEPTPLIDLSIYLHLMQWLYAVRVFRDTLVPNKLVENMKNSADFPFSSDPIIHALEDFSMAIDAALPVSMAQTALKLRQELNKDLPAYWDKNIFLGRELLIAVGSVASEFIPNGDYVPEVLDIQELERQETVIDKLLDHGRLVQAIGLMREWIVLKILFHNGDRTKWRHRPQIELAERFMNGQWPDAELGKVVKSIRDLRNTLQHYGQSEEHILNLETLANTAFEKWNYIKKRKSQYAKWRFSR